MLSDLFSTFDPSISTVYRLTPAGFWSIAYLITALISPSQFPSSNRNNVLIGTVLTQATTIANSSNSAPIQGASWLLASLFLMLVIINLAGLVPWVISISSHLVFTVVIALPLWLASVLATSTSPTNNLATLVGSGLPLGLAPLIGLIEVVSFLIRPLTLALRLAANIMAGHVIIGLLIGALMSAFSANSFLLAFLVVGIYLFETAICLVQAYVFILLLSIYVREWVLT